MNPLRRSPTAILDPLKLAHQQLSRDRAVVRYPGLLQHKIARMQASPMAFLRGSAPLFYEILALRPSLAEGPSGEGWIAGDLHLENFGAFRTESGVVFAVNDFDDAVVGPWRFDVLRLLTSLLLAARDFGLNGTEVLKLCAELLSAYWEGACKGKAPGPKPPIVSRLVARTSRRTRIQLLNERAPLTQGKRRFVRGDRYQELPSGLQTQSRQAFSRYAAKLPKPEGLPVDAFDVLDVAFRIAGTGSLGKLRVAVLAKGWGGKNAAWLFEMKEQGTPAPAVLLGKPRTDPGLRVVDAQRASLIKRPRMIGTARIGRRSMSVKRLAPQEDKLNLRKANVEELSTLAHYVGAITGAMHRRAATSIPAPWAHRHQEQLVDRAVALAGLHEAIYLCFCRLTLNRQAKA